MKIEFKAMTEKHLPLWLKWSEKPHVKDVWFIDGYETVDYIHRKIAGNGYDHPFMIYLDDLPIGYIVCCDLYAYKTICPTPNGLFTNEDDGTFCMDLFIGEEAFLNKGLGTQIVSAFGEFVFDQFSAKRLLIDPALSNKRAIRCYEKAGFVVVGQANDGVTDCLLMEYIRK